MTSLAIDTLRLTNRLKARGYTEEQAIGFAEALQDINLDQLVTRADLKVELAEVKFELLKWMFGSFLGVFVMLVGIFMKLG